MYKVSVDDFRLRIGLHLKCNFSKIVFLPPMFGKTNEKHRKKWKHFQRIDSDLFIFIQKKILVKTYILPNTYLN